jgi:hypothetical protein
MIPECNLALIPNAGINRQLLPSALAGIDRQLLLGSTVALAVSSCWDRPSAFAGIDRRLLPSALTGIDRRLLLGSTASCKVSSANGNCTRRFGAAE